jgi:hypothetical protein
MARPPVLGVLIKARRFLLPGMTKFESVEAKALSERVEVLRLM